MIRVIHILLILIPFNSIGQLCDTTSTQVMNCIDENGLKQGYWETRQYRDGISCVLMSMDTPPEERDRINRESTTVATSGNYKDDLKEGIWITYFDNEQVETKGSYIQGLKTGLWTYYVLHYDSSLVESEISYEIENDVSTEKIRVIYALERDFLVKVYENAIEEGFSWIRDYPYSYHEISSDSLTIKGETKRGSSTVSFTCADSFCEFLLPTGTQLMSFRYNQYSDFEIELYKLNIGMYDREVKMKTKR